jgi:hypothetical protein
MRTPEGFELCDARGDQAHHQIDDLAAFANLNRVEAVMAQDPKRCVTPDLRQSGVRPYCVSSAMEIN